MPVLASRGLTEMLDRSVSQHLAIPLAKRRLSPPHSNEEAASPASRDVKDFVGKIFMGFILLGSPKRRNVFNLKRTEELLQKRYRSSARAFPAKYGTCDKFSVHHSPVPTVELSKYWTAVF